MTDLINELVPEEDKLTVFPRGGPFLATQKIGKNNQKEAKIRKSNEVRQEWNAVVSDAMMRGMPVKGQRPEGDEEKADRRAGCRVD